MPDLARLLDAVTGARSIRTRLLWLALFPLAVVLPLLLCVLVEWGGDYFDRLLVTKVRADLAVAHGYFERVTEGVGRSVAGLADSRRLSLALRQPAGAGALLLEARDQQQLDFLRFLPVGSAALNEWRMLGRAGAGEAVTEIDLFSPRQLAAISGTLAERAAMPLLPTLSATPDNRDKEERGLVIHTAAPVRDDAGRMVGVLEGGILLNKNLAFIDRLNEIVYPEGALPLGSHGTATLFLEDVRVATNVRLFEGGRAIGTRVSAAVRGRVLGEGEVWLDRAFVVGDWYVSGYMPLVDSLGRRVGMLYVGFLERPFIAAQRSALLTVIGLFALAMLAAGVFAVWRARQIFRPIERMHATMNAIEQGDEARVGPVDGRDELGELAEHFDHLLDRLQLQTDALKRWGQERDAEVARRTAELQQALIDLRAAQSRLITQEKLAAVGQLTAGLAHEINNPVAVIQGNVEVLRDLLGAAAQPVEPEIRLIVEQVNRIRLIVAKLLQFARPQDFVGYLEPVGAASLFQDCLVLVAHLLKRGTVEVRVQCDSQRQVLCNRSELQQVLINLMVNAIEAMPDGGQLSLLAEDWDEAEVALGIRLTVCDSGRGIAPDEQERLFQPFHTVGKAGGNGLGLWVSRSLVERYGGHISVRSVPGEGSAFSACLRGEPLGSDRPGGL